MQRCRNGTPLIGLEFTTSWSGGLYPLDHVQQCLLFLYEKVMSRTFSGLYSYCDVALIYCTIAWVFVLTMAVS